VSSRRLPSRPATTGAPQPHFRPASGRTSKKSSFRSSNRELTQASSCSRGNPYVLSSPPRAEATGIRCAPRMSSNSLPFGPADGATPASQYSNSK